MSEDNIIAILSILRRIANAIARGQTISPQDLDNAKQLAAECYLRYNHREIELKRDDYNIIVDLLRFKIEGFK